jgi:hypothetical protein
MGEFMAMLLETMKLELDWADNSWGSGLLGRAEEIRKIGKCFHTGNMGFPPGEGVEDW